MWLDEQKTRVWSPLENSLFFVLSDIVSLRGGDDPVHMKSVDLSNQMQLQATSHPADETLATCSLVGVSVSIPVDVSIERRMQESLLQLGKTPALLLFHDNKMYPFSRTWISESMMVTTKQLRGTNTAMYLEEGLIGEYDSLRFDSIMELSHELPEGSTFGMLMYLESIGKTLWEVGFAKVQAAPEGGVEYLVINFYLPDTLGYMCRAVAVLDEKASIIGMLT